MARSTPSIFFGSDFDRFLHAQVGREKNGTPISVLSALVRQNIDPWEEAAKLDRLHAEVASEKLATLIATLPGSPATQEGTTAAADRLVGLLPRLVRPIPHKDAPITKPPLTDRRTVATLIIFSMFLMIMILLLGGRPH